MSLGYSVEELLPRARGGGALRMGLVRLGPEAWLDPVPDRSARAATFDAHPDAIAALPGAEAAAEEAAALVGVSGGLGDAARAIHEDLCLVLPLAAVHAPIHGYAEQLSAGVDHFIATLAPGAIFGRANWFVVPTAAPRYLPADDPARRFAHVTVANAGRTLFVRCERQTLRRLPESGAILFTIGIYAAPLDDLSSGAVARVAGAVATIAGGEHDRRAAPHYADALTRYAATRKLETAA